MWLPQSILRRLGRRHMPGVCRYPSKGTGQAVKQGGSADNRTIFVQYSSLTERLFLSGRFLFSGSQAAGNRIPAPWSFCCRNSIYANQKETAYVIDETMAPSETPLKSFPAKY